MNDQKKSVLPPNFDGVFRFTNRSNEEFVAKWGGNQYKFPPMSTTPMIIPSATPEEVQHIRKKFATEYATIQFYKTPKFVGMNNVQPGGVPALYTDSDLAPFIQQCLEPLPVGTATVEPLPKDTETRYRKDNKGRNVSRVIEQGDSLVGDGTEIS